MKPSILVPVLCTSLMACGGHNTQSSTKQISTSPVNSTAIVTLGNRLIAGYQGWFGCPGDDSTNTEWIHWFNGTATVDHLTVEMIPDVTGLPPEALCNTGLKQQNGQPLVVFTSQHPVVIQRHFEQMKANGVGAVALQRFVSQLDDPRLKARMDKVLDNAIQASNTTGLPFYITYDVSGANPTKVIDDIRSDWSNLQTIITNTNYLHDNNKPVIELWGFGFINHPGEPSEVQSLLNDLKQTTTIIGGVPTDWNTLTGDSKTDPQWTTIYKSYDVISPWSVGRYANNEQANTFIRITQAEQMSIAKQNNQGFLPVVFPGFSWHNLMSSRGQSAPLNQIPRLCGKFLNAQIVAQASLGVKSVYLAMYDEMDEGTAMLPTLAHKEEQPENGIGLSLDIDGCELNSDFYLSQITKAAQTIGQ